MISLLRLYQTTGLHAPGAAGTKAGGAPIALRDAEGGRSWYERVPLTALSGDSSHATPAHVIGEDADEE
jgi:hypothetical protein